MSFQKSEENRVCFKISFYQKLVVWTSFDSQKEYAISFSIDIQVFGENFRREFAAVTPFFIGGFRLCLENVPCALLDSKFEQGWKLRPGLILRKSCDLRVVLLEGVAPFPCRAGPSTSH